MKHKGKYLLIFIWVSFLLPAFFSGCSTTKNTFTRRVYHNLTSHFNVYFNGKESLKEGVLNIEKNHEDNYLLVLPVYKLGTKEKVQSVSPQLDKAIAKATKTVQLHSIFLKGVEHIKWIDDAWMLMGKANYYKMDYTAALRIFDFVRTRYSKNPIRYDAMLWMAKTNTRLNNYVASQALLDQVVNHTEKNRSTKFLDKDIPLAYADLYVSRGSNTEAIAYLGKALVQKQKKNTQLRIYYILGQLYQQKGNTRKASDCYKLALKGNTSFIMSFNTKLKLAECYDNSQGNSKEIKDLLAKMLKDSKNKEYLDQIYYALAQVELKQNNENEAIKYLKQSVGKSITNNYQKAVSALTLADLFFKKPDFIHAGMYYDTAMLVLPKEYPDYDQIKDKTTILDALVKNLLIIQTEDSLQQLAAMPEAERNKIIDKLIEAYKLEEERKRKEQQIQMENQNILTQNSIGNNMNRLSPQTQNSWYFYNTSTLQFGYNEFIRKWGNRKLEDNWLLSNKQLSGFDMVDNDNNPDNTDQIQNNQKKESGNPLDRNYYLKNLPFKKEQVEASNKRIQQAMYEAGVQYAEGLYDYARAIEIFEKLLAKYPECPQKVNACYQLYKIYTQQNQPSKAETYKNILVSQFPESDYAKLLTDPDYYKKMQQKIDIEKNLYSQTYSLFQAGNYNGVIVNCDTAFRRYKNTPVTPKFEYLKSLSKGKIWGNDTLAGELNLFIKKYTTGDLNAQAKILLEYLNKDTKKDTPKPSPSSGNELYKVQEASPHMFILFIDDKNNTVSTLKNIISDFNLKFYSLEKLPINSIMGFRGSQQIISVSNIGNREKALLYYVALQKDDKFKAIVTGISYDSFIITSDNYATLYKTKDLNSYKEFFLKNYGK